MGRPTPNIDLILQKWPGVHPDLKAQVTKLYFTTKQFDKEMGIIAHIIRSDLVSISMITLAMLNVVYLTVWDAEVFLKVVKRMKRDDFKAKFVLNTKDEKLLHHAAAPGRSVEVAALLHILDGGLVHMARGINDVRNEYMTQIEEKELEIRKLTKEMEFEIAFITNYNPLNYGTLNKECLNVENRRLMEQGSPALLPSDSTFELCYDLHHKEVLQSHKEAYIKRTISPTLLLEYPLWKKPKTSVPS